ncbi:metallophosphoesterase [Halobaculum limi]|uniref:metallophosphoesterase n=1 Tax=Halobaculum limi TaxID=3031916 RepID=UPI00240535D2|nr:metallophosphoesterase [Halobaculum sp. YSMS11]
MTPTDTSTDATPTDATRYYFISDLHIGGDEALQEMEFESELLAFLRDLAAREEDAELIVNGDLFGLWEFTELDGMEKFDALVELYPELFEQLRATGEHVPITIIPGNHDYELACYPEYVDRLAEYNVTLEQDVVITREVAGRTIWIEHGQQRDPNNASPDFGNPYANPPGYFVNQQVTSKAGKLSKRGKYNWLKDIQSVTPMTEIPSWVTSMYFYREMSPFLRYVALPFLLLFNISSIVFLLFVLSATGVWGAPYAAFSQLLASLNVVGAVIDLIIVVNIVVMLLLVVMAVPLYVLARDVRGTLARFGIVRSEEPETVADRYVDAARTVFANNPDVAVFVYGHTHRAAVTPVDDRAVVNTGTWLKRFQRRSVVLGLLPWVYYPSFKLNYVRIAEVDGDVAVDYEVIEKQQPHDLTWLERLLTLTPSPDDPIPARTVIDGWQQTETDPTESTPEASDPGRAD